MIDITVKTLDSQNHRYSVPDNITVKQFKDRIASSVNIPSDKQRLIYCGRVLNDDKTLSEYSVHEKVIHLVMRAPPQPNRIGDRQANGTSSSNGGVAHSRPASTVPSSSGMRLQQAKAMLDNAAERLSRLESDSVSVSSGNSAANQTESSCVSAESSSSAPLETSSSVSEAQSHSQSLASSRTTPCSSQSTPCSSQSNQQTNSLPSQPNQSTASELVSLYQEMDALNNVGPTLDEGPELLAFGMRNPLMGVITNGLQGGLAHAAFASAMSSIGAVAASSSASQSSSAAAPPPPPPPPQSFVSSVTGDAPHQSPGPYPSEQPTSSLQRDQLGSQPTSGNPLSGLRGITVRITNRGSQRPTGIRLEHPRCSVMVSVLDQLRQIQSRLQPFLDRYYTIMTEDLSYEGNADRQERDQLLIVRVSSVLHYLSHATHAISDIMIDLRRTPPRQLRARPFIIPQPALLQAQINVGGRSHESVGMRARERRNIAENMTGSASARVPSSSSSSVPLIETSGLPPASPRGAVDVNDYMDTENEVVLMHVGPSGIVIDSVSSDGRSNDGVSNARPELMENLLSFTSELELRLGGEESSQAQPSSSSLGSSTTQGTISSNNSSSCCSSAGVQSLAPVHNSQATGSSGTSTTNATQTRVTPRAQQVHVTPLHIPGMGMTQFDPFLPCQSHHIGHSPRRRHHATVQTSLHTAEDTQERSEGPSSLHASSDQASLNVINHESASGGVSTNPLTHLSNLLSQTSPTTTNSGRQQTEEEQQQEQMFAQLVRVVMSEVSGTIVGGSVSDHRGPRSQQSLQEFLELFVGGLFDAEEGSDSLLPHLFTTVTECLRISDLVDVFFGNCSSLNRLLEPLQLFVRERILSGSEASEANLDVAIDQILADIDNHVLPTSTVTNVHEGIDYISTIHNFLRHRLHDIFNLIINHTDQSNFGSVLVCLLRRVVAEFVELSLHCFVDGVEGLERLVEARLHNMMSGMSSSIQAWTVNTSLLQLRSMMSDMTITDDHIRRYVVSPDEGARMVQARQNRTSTPLATAPAPLHQATHDQVPIPRESHLDIIQGMDVEAEDGTDVEVIPRNNVNEVDGSADSLPIHVGSQSWHSAVPSDWIPVITRDAEHQRRRVPECSLRSDGYLCGVPMKRRRITTKNKPQGAVHQVLREMLGESLSRCGVTGSDSDVVSSDVPVALNDAFAAHARNLLLEELAENGDFCPERFPNTDRAIRRKY